MDEDRNPRRTPKQVRETRIAYRPSERQRKLISKKADDLSGRDELLYKGEDLKRGRR